MQTDDFEKRLSALTLRHPSPSYSDKGHAIIREQTRARSRHTVYLNYALALSLLLSLGINLLLLAGYREDVRELTTQCEINTALEAPDNHPSTPSLVVNGKYLVPASNKALAIVDFLIDQEMAASD